MTAQNIPDDSRLDALATQVVEALSRRGARLVTAESCTGGWIAKVLTDVPGCSAGFECGFVTYSNDAKTELLGVPHGLLVEHGAVSEPVVRAMAAGALSRGRGDISVAVSGVAGPGGGSTAKPLGTVWLAWSGKGGATSARHFRFEGDRDDVRRQAVAVALEGVLARLDTT